MPDEIKIPDLTIEKVNIEVIGTSPLIMHRWSEKAKKAMLDKQMKRATAAKEAKDPDQDFEDSIYYLRPDKAEVPEFGTAYGFPAVAFKAAAVRAGTYLDFKMTFLRGAFHVPVELVPIVGKPEPREDMVRVGNGVADIRYRAEFTEWSAKVPVDLNATSISLEQIVNLFRTAGFAVGVGEWRPEKDGQYGRYEPVEVSGR